jgi:DNA polymerase-4
MEQGFYASTVEFSYVGTNLTFSHTRQKKLSRPTNLSGEIANAAYELFKKHYGHFPAPLRKIGVRGSNLVSANAPRQLTITEDGHKEILKEELERTINNLRARFGNKIIQRGIMYLDTELSKVDAKKNHTIYPVGVFKEAMPGLPANA